MLDGLFKRPSDPAYVRIILSRGSKTVSRSSAAALGNINIESTTTPNSSMNLSIG